MCVAGLHERKSIRLHEPPPSESWLHSMGGLSPGDVVTASWKSPKRCERPHLEDQDWSPSSLSKVERLSEEELVERLSLSAHSSICDAFGKPLFFSGHGNAAFPPSKGARSLASVVVSRIRTYPFEDGIRVDFADNESEWTMVPLEDLTVRTHQIKCDVCSTSLAQLLTREFDGAKALLRVGLTRPFQAGNGNPGCYLQVNHIFLTPSKRKHFV